MRRTLIVGATSAIAQETAKLLAKEGDHFFLMARDSEKLQAIRDDLLLRGATRVETGVFEALEFETHEERVDKAYEALGGVELAVIAHGDLPDQDSCQGSYQETLKAFQTNALSVFSLLILLSERFNRAEKGTLVVISSVAGDRGRRSNYVYGSAKGAVTLFLQGLRSRLHPQGIRVITVKPGLVDTPMTQHLRKGIFWATPDRIAKGIHRALRGSRNVVYLPWYWRWIMLAVRLIPEPLFKRLDF